MTLYKLKLRNGVREEYIVVNLDKFACAEALDSGRHSVIRLHFEGVPHDTIVDWEIWQDLKTKLLRMSQRGANSLDREDPAGAEFDPSMSSNTMYDEIVRTIGRTMGLSAEPAYIAGDMFTTGDTSIATTTTSHATATGGAT